MSESMGRLLFWVAIFGIALLVAWIFRDKKGKQNLGREA